MLEKPRPLHDRAVKAFVGILLCVCGCASNTRVGGPVGYLTAVMLRRGISLFCLAPAYRTLDAGELLSVIQRDHGETASYYAKRYFGPKTEMRIAHLLWADLKKHGHVDCTRVDADAAPRWFPAGGAAHRAPRVLKYRAEDHDLSVLKMENDLGRSQEHDVVSELQGVPSSGAARAFATSPQSAVPLAARWRSDLEALAAEAKEGQQQQQQQ